MLDNCNRKCPFPYQRTGLIADSSLIYKNDSQFPKSKSIFRRGAAEALSRLLPPPRGSVRRDGQAKSAAKNFQN